MSASEPAVHLLKAYSPATGAVNSLGVVLGQEMERFNKLLLCMSASLQQLSKALKVTPLMPMELLHIKQAYTCTGL